MQRLDLVALVTLIVTLAACGGGGDTSRLSAIPVVNPGAPAAGATASPSASPATIAVATYASPNAITSIAIGPDGNAWFTQTQQMIGVANATTGAIASYNGVAPSQQNCSVPSAPPSQQASGQLTLGPILAGPNGTLWYGAWCGGALLYGYSGFNQMSTTGTIAGTAPAGYNPPVIAGATVGSDGSIWAAELGVEGPEIWSYAPPTGAGTPCDGTQMPRAQPSGIASGSDGALWMPAYENGDAVLIRSTTSCALSTPVSVSGTTFDSRSIASAGGALWVIDIGRNQIDKITTAGTLTPYAVPKAWVADSNGNVGYVAASPNGNYVYFDDTASAQIGRLNLGTGQIQEFALQAGGAAVDPEMLAVDANGNAWTYSGATLLRVTFPS